MALVSDVSAETSRKFDSWLKPGLFWLTVATLGAMVFFADGLDALLEAWALPEYSHGPLIPVLSALLFLRQLKSFPTYPGPKRKRWVGVTVIVASLALAALGKLSNISDLVAYATILWVGGILLVGFGWTTGKHFWPPVVHLVYMLPLPGVIYYKMTTWLQFISSELGVYFLQLLSIPVFLEGNIIDLGVTKLHVAEACSGLRYLFPILSFSYVFAVLYKGPTWHKVVLLISAAPITVFMNSVRIAVAGIIVEYWGLDWLEGFTHFFEGWVIFVACILILFALARIMLFFNRKKMGLVEALDLDTTGLWAQGSRLRLTQASNAMILSALLMTGAALGWQTLPDREISAVTRVSFAEFPRRLGDWRQQGAPRQLSQAVTRVLAADDYRSVNYTKRGSGTSVEFFSAWYEDQSKGGVHSPEICLPGGGWELAWLERADMSAAVGWKVPFVINRAIIQKGTSRMIVFYWFDQKGRKIAWDLAAKYYLLVDGVRTGRTDGALVRLTTEIMPGESDAVAEERLVDLMREALKSLNRFVPA